MTAVRMRLRPVAATRAASCGCMGALPVEDDCEDESEDESEIWRRCLACTIFSDESRRM